MTTELWLLLVIALLLLLIVSRMRTPGTRKFRAGGVARRSVTSAQRAANNVEWREVEELVRLGRSSNLKTAILEADKLLDQVLRQLGASGDTLSERLRSARPRFSNYGGVWAAHKLRNRIVHEEVELTQTEVQRSVKEFRQALKDLGGIDG